MIVVEYDYIVVGGGSGGCVVAGRLSEDRNMRVCLIEAGGDGKGVLQRVPFGTAATLPTPLANYGYKTVPQQGLNGRLGYQPRGRGLGGSSAINAMLYVRGHAKDYDEWRDLGCTGWGYEDVLPYFKKAEGNERGDDDFHSGSGPLTVSNQRSPHDITHAFVEAGRQSGIPVNEDFNGERQEGVGLYQVTQRDGERCSAAAAYIHGQAGRPNLFVRTRTKAVKLVMENGRATGVVVKSKGGKGGKETLTARGEIVLALGAFNTPQFLMVSGIGPAGHLRQYGIDVVADKPAVGQNLQDHIDYIMAYRSDRKDLFGLSARGAMNLFRGIGQWRKSRDGLLTSPFAEGGGFLKSRPDIERPDLQLHFVVGIVENHMRRLVLGHGFSCHVCVLRPKSRGTVQLSDASMDAKPLIDMGFLSEREDVELMIAGFRRMRQIMEAEALAPWRKKELHSAGLGDDASLEMLIRNRADTVYHPVGTCRMGNDAGAVVDAELRVKGLEGLRIADASIMPRLVGGNTNAPTIMIAEKCADMMKAAQGVQRRAVHSSGGLMR